MVIVPVNAREVTKRWVKSSFIGSGAAMVVDMAVAGGVGHVEGIGIRIVENDLTARCTKTAKLETLEQ